MKEEPQDSHLDKPQRTNSKASNNYNLKEKKILVLVFEDPNVGAYRDYVQEHVVIYKFMGIWPVVKSLN